MDSPYRRLIEVWFGAQVELHGQYSIARLESLHAYAQRTPMWRVLLICTFTPAIAVLLITLTDAIPLQDPVHGLGKSLLFWIRSYITVCAVAGGAVFQLRIIVPKLGMSYTEVVVLTLIATTAAVATQFGFAAAIGYPVPFGLVMGTPSCLVVIVAGVIVPRRELLRTKPQVGKQLRNYVHVLICQVSMTVVYPIYSYVFMKLGSSAQTAFVMLLPVIKLVNKNWISHALRETDDLRPELVVFNIEIFHALYVSICMQSSTSINTTIAIMAIDLLQVWLSIRDVNEILHDMDELLEKVPPPGRRVSIEAPPSDDLDQQATSNSTIVHEHRKRNIIEAAVAVLAEDKNVRNHASMRLTCFVSSQSRRTSSITGSAVAALGHRLMGGHKTHISVLGAKYQERSSLTSTPSKAPKDAAIHPFDGNHDVTTEPSKQGQTEEQRPKVGKRLQARRQGLNGDERVRLVQKTLQMLFLTEFVVLVEYAEVMIPIIYNACTVGMIRLPNREFYKLFAGKTDKELERTSGNVALYGGLEYLSFVLFCIVLRHKLRFSVLTQVAFVLENQFVMVQAKLMMWVFYVIQTSLQHFGADFSFSFSWLHVVH